MDYRWSLSMVLQVTWLDTAFWSLHPVSVINAWIFLSLGWKYNLSWECTIRTWTDCSLDLSSHVTPGSFDGWIVSHRVGIDTVMLYTSTYVHLTYCEMRINLQPPQPWHELETHPTLDFTSFSMTKRRFQARKSKKYGDSKDYSSVETKSSPWWGKSNFRVHVEGEVLLQIHLHITILPIAAAAILHFSLSNCAKIILPLGSASSATKTARHRVKHHKEVSAPAQL